MISPTRRGPDGTRRPRRDLNRWQPRHGKESWLAQTTWDERAELEAAKAKGGFAYLNLLFKLSYRKSISSFVYPGSFVLGLLDR